ncbi:MAG: DUF4855 domain-containing protein [Eubacteriales bacterium]
MKKLSLTLALLFIITALLAACSGGGKPVGSESSSLESGESFGDNSAESKDNGQNTSEESSLPEEPEVFEHATVVSAGKPYTTTIEPGEVYPDSYNLELTDGLFAPSANSSYSDTKFVGYAPGVSSSCDIVVDLEEEMTDVYQFAVSYLSVTVAGIAPPSGISVYISSDNEKWEIAGRCTIPAFEASTTKLAVLTLKRSVKARYVKFSVQKGAAWIFLDEVMVIANIESDDAGEAWVESLREEYQKETLTHTDRAAALESISEGMPDRSLFRENIARGTSYTVNAKTVSALPDENKKKLTDGKVSQYLEGGTWVGYESGGGEVEIILTLKSARKDISAFELYAYNNQIKKVSFPAKVTFYVSSDKKDWVEVGRAYAPDDNGEEVYTYMLELEKEVSGRYIKFTLSETDCEAFYIEEVKVIAYVPESEKSALYPVIVLPDVNGDSFWPSNDPDYNSETNLLLGLTPQISSIYTIDNSLWTNNTPVTSKLMTDGVFSTSNDIHSGRFFKFNQGGGRDLIFDLTKLSAADTFTASFTNRSEWAVASPTLISVKLSDNGKDWYAVGEIVMDNSSDPGISKGVLTLDAPVAARFVAFSFTVATWAGCDELEVMGTKKVDGSTKRLSDSDYDKSSSFMSNSFMAPSDDILGGVRDLYLVYHSLSAERTKEELLPALAYLGEDGEIKDTMFDGFLFLLSGKLKSGYAGHEGFTTSDVDWLIATLFGDNKNINALESAAGQVKDTLDIPDYKYKFYVSLYYPKKGGTFGDAGDGILTLNTLADRLFALVWFMDAFEDELAKYDYKNIEFAGYYWYNESVNDNDGDLELLNGISDIIHDRNSQLFWIPYYQAKGYALWAEHGFDIACMQPNYAFGLDRPIDNIINTVALAKRYSMGIEIEIDSKAFSNDLYLKRYMEYLKSGVTYGYINDCVHMYYMAMNDLNVAQNSENPKLRLIYDYTYHFIKGSLNITPPVLENTSITCGANTPLVSNLNPGKDITMLFKLVASPAHGTVSINPDGSFTYYPDKNYSGEDSFSFVYSRYLDYSLPCEVTVTVE